MEKLPFHLNRKKIVSFCKKYHIIFMGLFGSVLTSRFKKTSDVDVLVKFDKKHVPSLFDIVDIEEELTSIIGRTVDLKTPNDLSPYFREEVLTNAKMIYAK